jgi:acetate kinase
MVFKGAMSAAERDKILRNLNKEEANMNDKMQSEVKAAADLLRNELEKDGVIVCLTAEEALVVRKVLQCANQLYTVIEPEYKENKIDALLRKLRKAEQDNA